MKADLLRLAFPFLAVLGSPGSLPAESLLEGRVRLPSGEACIRRDRLDLDGNWMYWTESGAEKIQRARLNGANVQDLVTGLGQPRGIALDLEGGRMYWTDIITRKVQSAGLDGSNVLDLVTRLDVPTAIVLE